MAEVVRAGEAVGAVARHNEVVLENARTWADAGSTVRVQVSPQDGQRPCGVCRHLVGTYTLAALPQVPGPRCEREGGCTLVLDLILLA